MKNRWTVFIRFAAGFIVLICLSTSLAQKRRSKRSAPPKPQTEKTDTQAPTLQETLDWLNANFNYDNQAGTVQKEDGTHFFHSLAGWNSFKGCTLSWANRESVVRNDAEHSTVVIDSTQFTADLATLDPNKVAVGDKKVYWVVELRTTNEDAKIKVKADDPSIADSINTAWIIVSGKQRGERIAVAFKNAIARCGGKKEPF